MTSLVPQIVGGALLLAGSFFLLVGALGLIRMPDLFSRMHAASVGETLGGSLLIMGMMFYGGLSLATFKLLILLAVILFFGPVATHALARAARYAGVEPQLSGTGTAQLAGATATTAKAGDSASKARRKPARARRKPIKKKGRK